MLYLPVETEGASKSTAPTRALETSETKKDNILLQTLKIHSPRLDIIWHICWKLND